LHGDFAGGFLTLLRTSTALAALVVATSSHATVALRVGRASQQFVIDTGK